MEPGKRPEPVTAEETVDILNVLVLAAYSAAHKDNKASRARLQGAITNAFKRIVGRKPTAEELEGIG